MNFLSSLSGVGVTKGIHNKDALLWSIIIGCTEKKVSKVWTYMCHLTYVLRKNCLLGDITTFKSSLNELISSKNNIPLGSIYAPLLRELMIHHYEIKRFIIEHKHH